MSESTSASMSEKRPWHDGDNPWESIYQHFTAEIAKLRDELLAKPVDPVSSDYDPSPHYVTSAGEGPGAGGYPEGDSQAPKVE